MPVEIDRRRSALIIANPTAGTVDRQVVDDLARLCRRWLPSVEVAWTGGRGDATTLAAAATDRDPRGDRPGVVLAVGGDGTVREVVEGLVGSGTARGTPPTLLIVPAGTGNSNYLAQWGDLPWRQAVAGALDPGGTAGTRGEVRLLDLFRLRESGELVLLGACSGLIAQALRFAADVPLTGRPRYREAMARAAAAFTPYPGRVEVDGRVVHEGGTVLANVGGGRHRGGQYRVLPHSVLDDGLLDVCVIGDDVAATQVPELTREAAHLDHPAVVYARGTSVTVARTDGEPLWFEHDGELMPMRYPTLTLDVLPRALPVACRADRRPG
ncbi:diacylglycerol/lipid kinase family protein [Salinispora mooreana]|uniref:diacylglycerol/lipid kinase family protein n=1 Tax=Salinispora mooreana TaxID=999545 RepID=UPI0003A5C29A|nr:diacylglycerol kinase family protein [Salinispora mooreana]